MNLMKEHEENKLKENSIIKELREEITHLKKWKESAILETVDKDRQAKCIIDWLQLDIEIVVKTSVT